MATYYWVGGTGTWSGTGNTQFAITSGGAATLLNPTNADTVNFDANSGTAAVVTVDSTAVSLNTTINKSDINLSLSGNVTLCTTVGSLTLTAGTITLNNFILTTGFWVSSNTNVRSIAFGTSGELRVNGLNTLIWFAPDVTNFSYTGTSRVNFTYAGGTGTRFIRHGSTAGGSATTVLDFYFSAGTDIISFTAGAYILNLDFTGFSGTLANTAINVYGNYKLSSGITLTAGTSSTSFLASSGTQQITTNGKTLDFPLIQNGAGGTVQLQDNLTMGSTRTYTLINGTLDLNNLTLSAGLFASSNGNTRSIAFGTGNITTTGSGTVWNTATVTNFSYTGTPTVNISNNSATAATVSTGTRTEAQSLNFNYTIGTYTLTDTAAVYRSVNFTGFAGTIPNSVRTIFGSFTLSTGMTLTAGANATTFASTSAGNTITNAGKTQDYPITFNGIGGVWACQDALTQGSTRAFTVTNGTVQLKNGVTSTVGAFATSGTNQKFLQSTLAGSQATISQASGTVDASYLTIQDINAVGGATWNAFVNQQNIDAGNNDGWDFGISPIVGSYEYTYQLRSFTQPRRF
jgi:hypothetical protein